jgi:hypothetical protein
MRYFFRAALTSGGKVINIAHWMMKNRRFCTAIMVALFCIFLQEWSE